MKVVWSHGGDWSQQIRWQGRGQRVEVVDRVEGALRGPRVGSSPARGSFKLLKRHRFTKLINKLKKEFSKLFLFFYFIFFLFLSLKRETLSLDGHRKSPHRASILAPPSPMHSDEFFGNFLHHEEGFNLLFTPSPMHFGFFWIFSFLSVVGSSNVRIVFFGFSL